MKFYNLVSVDGDPWPEESGSGEWATRADAEQLEKERNAYRDECITRGGRELQALCEKEQAAKERDEFERKLRELCQAHGILLIKFHDATKDAVRAAKLAQQAIYELYNGKPAHMRDYGYVASQAIIERYEGIK